MDLLSRSFEQLREAQERFLGNVATITLMKNVTDGSESLVPLTPSVYVDAKVNSSNGVLVDVGTGYYVQKVCLCCLFILMIRTWYRLMIIIPARCAFCRSN